MEGKHSIYVLRACVYTTLKTESVSTVLSHLSSRKWRPSVLNIAFIADLNQIYFNFLQISANVFFSKSIQLIRHHILKLEVYANPFFEHVIVEYRVVFLDLGLKPGSRNGLSNWCRKKWTVVNVYGTNKQSKMVKRANTQV